MSNKTVIVIMSIAAVLAAFIFFFERNTQTTTEQKERKNHAFADYRKDRVDKITLKHSSGNVVVLEKVPPKEAPEGGWKITKPKALSANESEVDSLLSALDYLLCDRAVKGEKYLTDPKFGIATPRIEGSFTIRGKTTTFKIGSDAEGDKVYLFTDQTPDTIFAVNADIVESLDKSANDLRDKRLIPEALDDVSGIDVARSLGTLSFSRAKGKEWQLKVGENKILAASDQVKELVGAVDDLSAEKFIADDVKESDLAQYGLASPSVSIRLTPKDGKVVEIRIGDSCKESPDLRYATVFPKGSGTVACIKNELSLISERPLMRFEETRLISRDKDDIRTIRLSSGDKSLTLEKGESEWKISGQDTKADEDTVTSLLTFLTEARAKRIDTDATALSSLPKPSGSITVAFGEEPEATLNLFGKDLDLLKVRRDGEPALVHMPSAMEPILVPDPLVFRSKTIALGETDGIDRIEIKGRMPQTLEKKDGTWQILSPLSAAADMTAVRNLAELLSTVKVERFVSPSARKEDGLDHPFAVITTRFALDSDEHAASDSDIDKAKKAPTTSVLEIGDADLEGRRYARLRGKDETLFLLGKEYETALQKPLIARDLLQIEETDLSRLTFKTQATERSFSKSDEGGWTADNGEAFNNDTFSKIIADLGGIKATGAESFGPAEPSFAAAKLVITAEFKGDNAVKKVITVSEKSAADAPEIYLARTSDVEATFAIPVRVIDDISTFLSAAEPKETEPQ